ncbi:MAG: diguanylate cyclase [Burkholderiaceae bacterium]|nr:diguanylate cyclase [Burkholderiaceae bacterium]
MIVANNTQEVQFALLNNALRAVRVGMIVLDAQERIVLWNRWMEQHAFCTKQSVLGKSFVDLFPELTNSRTHQAIKAALQNNFASLVSQTLNKAPFPLFAGAQERQAGTRVQQAVQVMPIEPSPLLPLQKLCLIQITDVSMAVAREKQLRDLALELKAQVFADGLTGIPNRRRCNEHLEEEFRRAKRTASPLSLIMIDVDLFKDYNDNYGHQKGDECLILVAAALTRILRRPGDLVARYGGEEFIAILPNTDREGALALAERMRSEVESMAIERADSNGSRYVTISLGVITEIPTHNSAISHMIGGADHALYQAKHQGRNCIVVHGSKSAPVPTAA